MSERAISLTGPFVPVQPADPGAENMAQAKAAKAAYDVAMSRIAAAPDPVAALEDVRDTLDELRELAMPAIPWAERPVEHEDGRPCYVLLPDGRVRRMLNADVADGEHEHFMDVTSAGDGVHTYIERQRLFTDTPTVERAVANGVERATAAALASVFTGNGDGDKRAVQQAVRQARDGQLIECVGCGHRSRRRGYVRCPCCGRSKTKPVMVREEVP